MMIRGISRPCAGRPQSHVAPASALRAQPFPRCVDGDTILFRQPISVTVASVESGNNLRHARFFPAARRPLGYGPLRDAVSRSPIPSVALRVSQDAQPFGYYNPSATTSASSVESDG